MEIIFEKVLSINDFSSSLIQVETKSKTFLVSLENQDNFYPHEGYCYEFNLEKDNSLSGMFKCIKMATRTVDFVLIHNDNIVLIKRKNEPFKGTLALPGGYVDEGEDPLNAAIRELKEEVNIDVNSEKLKLVTIQTLPFRDPRNKWTTSYVFLAKVEQLDSIKAGDDAESYVLLPIKEINEQKLAFDHLESIRMCLWPDSKKVIEADLKALDLYLKMGHSKQDALSTIVKLMNLGTSNAFESNPRYIFLKKYVEGL